MRAGLTYALAGALVATALTVLIGLPDRLLGPTRGVAPVALPAGTATAVQAPAAPGVHRARRVSPSSGSKPGTATHAASISILPARRAPSAHRSGAARRAEVRVRATAPKASLPRQLRERPSLVTHLTHVSAPRRARRARPATPKAPTTTATVPQPTPQAPTRSPNVPVPAPSPAPTAAAPSETPAAATPAAAPTPAAPSTTVSQVTGAFRSRLAEILTHAGSPGAHRHERDDSRTARTPCSCTPAPPTTTQAATTTAAPAPTETTTAAPTSTTPAPTPTPTPTSATPSFSPPPTQSWPHAGDGGGGGGDGHWHGGHDGGGGFLGHLLGHR